MTMTNKTNPSIFSRNSSLN